jgi:hypothetical protein
MTFVITHTSGAEEADPPIKAIEALITELDSTDPEHPDVSIADESGWALSAFPDNRVIWGNVEEGDQDLELRNVARRDVLRLFRLVAEGDLDQIRQLDWEPRG